MDYIGIGSLYILCQVSEALLLIPVGDMIVTTPAAKNIGVVVESVLSMEQQVVSICRACYVG